MNNGVTPITVNGGLVDVARQRYLAGLSPESRARFNSLPAEKQQSLVIQFISGNAEHTPERMKSAFEKTTYPSQDKLEKAQQFRLKSYERVVAKYQTIEQHQNAIDKMLSGELGNPEEYALVIGLIDKQMNERFSAEEIARVRDPRRREEMLQARLSNRFAVGIMMESNQEATARVQEQISEQGACSLFGEMFRSWWSEENTLENVFQNLKKQDDMISELIGASQTMSQKDFNCKFYELTGIEYPQEAASELQEKDFLYKTVLTYKNAMDIFQSFMTLEFSEENVATKEKALGGAAAICQLYPTYAQASSSEKNEMLNEILSFGMAHVGGELKKITGGKSYEQFVEGYREDRIAFGKLLGLENSEKMVDEYLAAQERDAGRVKIGATIVLATAIIVAPYLAAGLGKVGLVATGAAATGAATTGAAATGAATVGFGNLASGAIIGGSTAAVEVADRASNGIDDLNTFEDWSEIGTDAGINGALGVTGGYITSGARMLPVASGYRFLAGAGGNVGLGVGSAAAMNDGEVSTEEAVVNTAFGMLGGFGALGRPARGVKVSGKSDVVSKPTAGSESASAPAPKPTAGSESASATAPKPAPESASGVTSEGAAPAVEPAKPTAPKSGAADDVAAGKSETAHEATPANVEEPAGSPEQIRRAKNLSDLNTNPEVFDAQITEALASWKPGTSLPLKIGSVDITFTKNADGCISISSPNDVYVTCLSGKYRNQIIDIRSDIPSDLPPNNSYEIYIADVSNKFIISTPDVAAPANGAKYPLWDEALMRSANLRELNTNPEVFGAQITEALVSWKPGTSLPLKIGSVDMTFTKNADGYISISAPHAVDVTCLSGKNRNLRIRIHSDIPADLPPNNSYEIQTWNSLNSLIISTPDVAAPAAKPSQAPATNVVPKENVGTGASGAPKDGAGDGALVSRSADAPSGNNVDGNKKITSPVSSLWGVKNKRPIGSTLTTGDVGCVEVFAHDLASAYKSFGNAMSKMDSLPEGKSLSFKIGRSKFEVTRQDGRYTIRDRDGISSCSIVRPKNCPAEINAYAIFTKNPAPYLQIEIPGGDCVYVLKVPQAAIAKNDWSALIDLQGYDGYKHNNSFLKSLF